MSNPDVQTTNHVTISSTYMNMRVFTPLEKLRNGRNRQKWTHWLAEEQLFCQHVPRITSQEQIWSLTIGLPGHTPSGWESACKCRDTCSIPVLGRFLMVGATKVGVAELLSLSSRACRATTEPMHCNPQALLPRACAQNRKTTTVKTSALARATLLICN